MNLTSPTDGAARVEAKFTWIIPSRGRGRPKVKLRNGYQKEIDAAIRRAEIAERKAADKETIIERKKNRIDELDRKANPQRYRLSSGAELIGYRFLGNNPYTVTLKIWTKVKDIKHTAVTYLSDSDMRLHAFSNGELTNEARAEMNLFNLCLARSKKTKSTDRARVCQPTHE